MRNLKRVLSLAMAAAMLIGMMVVSAGAVSTYEDFTDKDEIQNTEAVNTMVSLGVINGKDDGSYFDPAGIVTRAEMAALIARCLNGGIDPSLGTGAATTTFSDTKGHWAEAYIAYCANLGIINGKGDGTFGPDETVTGTAAAKMFLCALGYRSEIEGLTGAGWDLNTDSLANKVGLYDGLTTIRPSDGLNRDNTAQLIYNGVQANEVEYRNNYGEYSGVIYPQPNGTVLTNRFRVVKVEGVVAANDVFGIDYSAHGSSGTAAAAKDGWTRMVDCNGYTTGNTTTYYDGVYPVAMGNELVGQRVVIYVKFQNALSPNASNSIVVGEPIVSNKTTVVETAAKLKDEDAVRGALRSSGLTIPTAGDQVEYVIDETGISKTASASNNDGIFTLTDDGGATVKAYALPGVVQRFIDNNGDGVVDIIFQEIAAISKVSSYNTKDNKLTLSNIGSKDFDDIANYEDVAKDDYVLVTKYGDTYYLDPVETVEGEVTAYNSGAKTLTVDGTAYAVSYGYKDHNKITSDLGVELNPSALSSMVGNSYTLYMDKSGNIIAAAVLEEGVGNYAVVTASGAESDMMGGLAGKVKLILADGTTGTYNVDLLASAKKFTGGAAKTTNSDKESWMADRLENVSGTGTFTDGAGNGLKNTIVTYVLNDDGSVVLGEPAKTVTPPATQKYYLAEGTAANVDEFVNSVSTYKLGGYNMVADNNTVFFFLDRNGSYSVTTGLNNISSRGVDVKTTDGNGAVKIVGYGTTSTKAAKAVFAEIEATSYTSTASYALITGKFTKTTENGDTVYTYPVVFEDGTEGTLKTKLTEEYADNTVYAYKQDSKGFVTEFNAADTYVVNNVYVSDRGSNTVTLNNLENYTQFTESYPFASGWKGWNVEDTSDIFDVDAAKYDVVAAVLNDSKAIRTLFVVDTIDEEEIANQTNAVAFTFTPAVGSDITAGDLTVAFTAPNQEVTATVNGTAVNSGNPISTGAVLYTVGAETHDGDVVNVVLTVKDTADTDKTNRVYRYSFNVALPAAAAPDASPVGAADANPATVATHPSGETKGTITGYTAGTADQVKITKPGDNAGVTYAIKSVTGAAKQGDTDVYKLTGADTDLVVVVTASGVGLKTTDYTYSYTVAGAVATTYSVTYSAGGTGSTTQMPAKVEGLAADATHTVSNVVPVLTDNTFVGWLSNEGTPALYKDGDTVTLNGTDVTLTAVFVADDVGVTDAAESGGLAAAGFKFTFTSDISALIAKVAAQGSGTNTGSIADEANAGTGTTEFVPTFDDSTDLSSCTSGDSFEFVITLNGGVTPVTLTYTYA